MLCTLTQCYTSVNIPRMGKADYNDRLKDYVQVNERIIAFYAKFPDGSLQSEVVTLTDKLVVIKGYAYRSPSDPRPGIGHSSMMIPGTTPYTEDSEVENAETSAWGRALAALGFEVKRSVASRQEIENKTHARVSQDGDDGGVKATRIALIRKAKDKLGDNMGMKWLATATKELGTTSEKLTIDQMLALSERISKLTKPDDDTQPPAEQEDIDW